MANQNEDRVRQLQNQMRALQEKMNDIEEEDIVKVKWHPLRTGKVEVHLSDGSILTNLPDTVMDETDPQARVVLAMLGELLTLREEVANIRAHIGGNRAPMTPAPELKGEATAFKDSVTAQAARENAQPDVPAE